MTHSTGSNKETYNSGKQTFSSNALLHSRTVVEKEGYVSTGILTHVEGEMMEIEMTEFKSFELSNPVNLTLYSPVGIHRLQSTVIAKAEGSIAVIFPARSLIGLEEKREAPRFEVNHRGKLSRSLKDTRETVNGLEVIEVTDVLPLSVRNISSTGVGFVLETIDELNTDEWLEATIQLGFELSCKLEIVRKEEGSGQSFYGARFHDINEIQQRSLRAFLLREHIAAYYRRKHITANQRFKG
ncbi:hypothetical protein Back11_31440 [Paenibacillus baekrokdamisoli]|uniref:Uncharacterized protein n=1 Tax=Paenibacillus baekrokdamisoli TaxID=1712516 RepID=A0A3G9JFR1_9BACL|nr:PilZ domain-containing protein [Paenibacillus baekrokdamisoli]MBB3071692.1 hypothetical protein [Paenibacillus baekrokdamisoli]BBH21799.1 hypothetical protein Back11_31440 [Paenibacillus baekrokdamisoli]